MFFKKDELSKFDFISAKEFFLALFLMFLCTVFSFIAVPISLKIALPADPDFFDSYYFGIVIFLLSSILTFYIIYYFCCIRRQRSLKEGLFLYAKSNKTYFICALVGIMVPLCSLPVIFKYAPKEFYAMDLVKSTGGMIYLFTSALMAPLFEEIFYRGFIFPFFQSKFNSFWAIVLTALFFGFSHFMNIGNAYVLVSLFFIYGTVLCLVRYFTNSLIPPIVTHYFHNLTLIIGFLIMSKF